MPEEFPDIIPYQKIYGYLHTAPAKRSRNSDLDEFWSQVSKRPRHSTGSMLSSYPSQVYNVINRTKQAQTVRMDIDLASTKSDRRLSTIFNNAGKSMNKSRVFIYIDGL